MASSGNIEKKFHGGSTGGFYVGVDWKVNSQSTSGNSSNVTATVYIRASGSGYTISSSASKNVSVTINGTSYSGTCTVGLSTNQKKTLLTKTVTVGHNSDGTKSCSFGCSVGVAVTLSGTYYGTVSHSGSGTFDKINLNTPPTMSGSLSCSPSGTIAENTSSIKLTWSKAGDSQGNGDKYQIYRYVNGSHNATFNVSSISTLTYTDTGVGGYGAGTSIYYKIWAGDSYGTWSNAITSSTITKNTLTGGSITGNSGTVGYGTTSFTINFSGGKNANGGTVRYLCYSDNITVYNQTGTTGSSQKILVWRTGDATPASSQPYVKFDDIKNYFKNSSFNGNLHIGLKTYNDYGSAKYNGSSIAVDLRTNMTVASGSTSINASSYYNIGGNKMVPQRKQVRLDWPKATDPLGTTVTYRVDQAIGSGGWTTLLSSTTGQTHSFNLNPGTASTAPTYKFRVVARNGYGRETVLSGEPSGQMFYYNQPAIKITNEVRAATTHKVDFQVTLSTNIPNNAITSLKYNWNNASSDTTLTTTVRTFTISSLKENSNGGYKIKVNDTAGGVIGLGETIITGSVPQFYPVLSMRKDGVGVKMIPNGTADFMVGGNAKITEGFVVHSSGAGAGTSGYIHIASITINGSYQNAPIEFKIAQRGKKVQPTLSLSLYNANNTTPGINAFTKDSTEIDAYVKDNTNGVYDIYIKKTESYDRVDVVDFKKGEYMSSTVISWKDALVTALPSGTITASLSGGVTFDKIYPVGSIYLSTSSTNPSTHFGGTWVAWGSGRVPVGVNTGDSDFSAAEKTGGAKTVTLTTAQMPSHTHTQNSHNHSQNAHTHTQNSHNHSQNAHSHSTRYKGFSGVSSSSSGFIMLRRNDSADSYDGTDEDGAISTTASNNATTATNQNTTASNNATTATNQSTGGGGSHTNLQPFITCYMWKRTA